MKNNENNKVPQFDEEDDWEDFDDEFVEKSSNAKVFIIITIILMIIAIGVILYLKVFKQYYNVLLFSQNLV